MTHNNPAPQGPHTSHQQLDNKLLEQEENGDDTTVDTFRRLLSSSPNAAPQTVAKDHAACTVALKVLTATRDILLLSNAMHIICAMDVATFMSLKGLDRVGDALIRFQCRSEIEAVLVLGSFAEVLKSMIKRAASLPEHANTGLLQFCRDSPTFRGMLRLMKAPATPNIGRSIIDTMSHLLDAPCLRDIVGAQLLEADVLPGLFEGPAARTFPFSCVCLLNTMMIGRRPGSFQDKVVRQVLQRGYYNCLLRYTQIQFYDAPAVHVPPRVAKSVTGISLRCFPSSTLEEVFVPWTWRLHDQFPPWVRFAVCAVFTQIRYRIAWSSTFYETSQVLPRAVAHRICQFLGVSAQAFYAPTIAVVEGLSTLSAFAKQAID